MALDPTTGSVWLGRRKILYQVEAQGHLRQAIRVNTPIRALSFDPSRGQLWVAMKRRLRAYDTSGRPIKEITPGGHSHLRTLVYDPTLDALWVADKQGQVRRYDPETDRLQFETQVAGQPALPLREYRPALAPDGEGGLWIAAHKHLIKLNATGEEIFRLTPFTGKAKQPIVTLMADPVAGGVWVASMRAVRRIEAQGQMQPRLTLGQDAHKLTIRALALYTDLLPPTLSFVSPAGNSYVPTNQPRLELHYQDTGIGVDTATLALTENTEPLTVTCIYEADLARCTPTLPFAEGTHTVQARIADFNGNRSALARVAFTVDTVPPQITLDVSNNGGVTNKAEFTLTGKLSETAVLSFNGAPLAVGADLRFSQAVTLVEGLNTYTFKATDAAGHATTVTASITRDTVPPPLPDQTQIQATDPAAGTVTVTGSAGSVEPNAILVFTNTRTGESVTVTANSDGSFSAQIAAQAGDTLEIRLADAAGNQSEIRPFSVGGSSAGLPPDPATVAPPLSETGITPMHEAMAFLYSDANPIQTGGRRGHD